jgi:hypothetical protein
MTELRPWAGFDSLVDGLAQLQARAREAAVRSVDEILTLRNWLIGAWIVAYEQEGADRARYGEGLIDALAAAFKARGVGGLGRSNLKNYRQIALTWPALGIRQTSGESRYLADIRQTLFGESGPGQIWQTLSGESLPALPTGGELQPWQDDAWLLRLRRELSFSHLLELSRRSDPLARAFYEVQALAHRWSVRELKRQRDSMLFERVGLSRDRQTVITVGGRHHFIDLLFFHRRLRCLVAIDLKIGAFGHEDAGQMNFYLSYLREKISLADENPPVGIVLCADKDTEEVHYATGNLDHKVFVSRYLTRLPTEPQLRAWLAEERELLARGPVSKEGEP